MNAKIKLSTIVHLGTKEYAMSISKIKVRYSSNYNLEMKTLSPLYVDMVMLVLIICRILLCASHSSISQSGPTVSKSVFSVHMH